MADLLSATCHPILLADRGFATGQFFRFLDALGWNWIIRRRGNIWVPWNDRWTPLSLLGKARPLQLDGLVSYGKCAAGVPYPGRLVVYADTVHPDPSFFSGIGRPEDPPLGEMVAAYGQRFTCEEAYKDQKNDPGEGFHLDCVKLGSKARWDRLWLIFAWAFYWMNVAGWEAEVRGLDVQWRANTVKTRTHAWWRLGHWALMDGMLFWRDLLRRRAHFRQNIPAVGRVPPPT